MLLEQLNHVVVAPKGCQLQRRYTIVSRRIDVGTLGNEYLGHRQMVSLSCRG